MSVRKPKRIADILKEKEWEFLEYDGWYMFVKDKDGNIFPVLESKLIIDNR